MKLIKIKPNEVACVEVKGPILLILSHRVRVTGSPNATTMSQRLVVLTKGTYSLYMVERVLSVMKLLG